MLKDYWREISTAAFKVVDYVSRGGMAVAAVLTNLVLIPVVTFYLLRDWDCWSGLRMIYCREIWKLGSAGRLDRSG